MGSMWDVGRKQLQDSFSSRRFLIVLGLFLVLSMVSVYIGIQNYQESLEDFSSGDIYGAAPEKPTLIEVFQPLFSFNMPMTAGLLGLLLSYDYISKEREDGTIELLLSYPIYRDEIINGKLAAGIFTVAFAILSALTVSSGLAIFMTGKLPGLETVSRLSMIWIGTVIYITFFIGLGTFFSTVFRSRWRSLIAGALVLILFIGTPFIADFAANTLYPYSSIEKKLPGPDTREPAVVHAEMEGRVVAEGEAVRPGAPEEPVQEREGPSREELREQLEAKRQRFKSTVTKISSSAVYKKFTGTMLGTRYNSQEGLEPTFAESLGSSFGYLVYLISQTSLVLAGAYGFFLRQDL
ncbi:MAG: ABC transporter permease [Candidatus Nanohaloarchaea archaeon]